MRTRHIVLTAAAVATLVGGGLVAARASDAPIGNGPDAPRTLDGIDPSLPSGLDPAGVGVEATPVPPPAASPEAAVTGLLDALIAGDAAASFSLLAEGDRAYLGPLPTWQDRISSLPRYLGYQVTGADGPAVVTEVTLEPRLDEVIGFVPGRATATWTTVTEDGGYRVSFSDSTSEPTLPSDEAATAAAQAWVATRQRCEPAATYDGNLLGQPSLADRLCDLAGMFRAGAAAGLESFRDPSLLLNAFGADAPTFVRVVPVEGPAPLQVALAPLGEAWEVIGVMQA